jgi:hypothetical protein
MRIAREPNFVTSAVVSWGSFAGNAAKLTGSMPYLPILDVLRSFLDIKEGEPEQAIKDKLKEKILGSTSVWAI